MNDEVAFDDCCDAHLDGLDATGRAGLRALSYGAAFLAGALISWALLLGLPQEQAPECAVPIPTTTITSETST